MSARLTGRSRARVLGFAATTFALVAATKLPALHAEPFIDPVAYTLDSGFIDGEASCSAIVFSGVVHVPDAAWLRLVLAEADLGMGSYLRLTSTTDGGVQHLSANGVWEWQCSSAYFNGDAVLVELIAGPGTKGNRVRIDEVIVGRSTGEPRRVSQCGPTDDRVRSTNRAFGRMLDDRYGSGCTGFIVDECGCMLAAGHCFPDSAIVQFNVPESNGYGALRHPPPSDQYAVDPRSIQKNSGGVGDDWAHFGVYPNPETGKTPYEAQGAKLSLADDLPMPPVAVRVTGYGVDQGVDNQVQQTAVATLVSISGNPPALYHDVDTEVGNSGSAIVLESNGEVIGIHTNAGCDDEPPPYNSGTPITHEALQAALADPKGVCAELQFEDAISREFSVLNTLVPPPTFVEAVSREFSVLNMRAPDIAFAEGLSREFSVLNRFTPEVAFSEGISREFSVLFPTGDLDRDGDIDLTDYGLFAECFTGPGAGPIEVECQAANFDNDTDLDLADVALLQNAFTGQ